MANKLSRSPMDFDGRTFRPWQMGHVGMPAAIAWASSELGALGLFTMTEHSAPACHEPLAELRQLRAVEPGIDRLDRFAAQLGLGLPVRDHLRPHLGMELYPINVA